MSSIKNKGINAQNPFQILRESRKRQILIDLFESTQDSSQNLLFRDTEISVSEYLDELSLLYEQERLYKSWKQQIGQKQRHLHVPNRGFEQFSRKYLSTLIKKLMSAHNSSHVGEQGWTPRKSLETHIPCHSVLTFDLSDAFHNLGFHQVSEFFYNSLSQYNEETRIDLALFLTFISTIIYQDRRVLPQGASHSSLLFNRALYNLDQILDEKARERGFHYSRWIDDFTISSPNILPVERFIGTMGLIGFPISQRKVFFQKFPQDIYALGHVISNGKVYKNSQEDRDKNKVPPYEKYFSDYFNLIRKQNYDSWD